VAGNRIPDPLERRHLVERELAPAQAQKLADAYLAEDRVVDAIDFLVRAGDEQKLRELRRRAIESGDVFLLRALERQTGAPAQREEWLEMAAAAERAGKVRYAAEARRWAERDAR
jgi:hypothetical protein